MPLPLRSSRIVWLLVVAGGPPAAAAPTSTAPAVVTASPASAPRGRLVITGAGALPEQVALEAAGPLPLDLGRPSLEAWAREAIARIVGVYKLKEYPYARAWYRVGRDGVRIHVDEGRVRVGFTGAGSVQGFFFRQNLNLPRGVIHTPSLQMALDGIKRTYDLLNIYHRVKEPGELEITAFNEAVPVRVLQVYIVPRVYYGWSFDLGVSATWGVLPALAYERALFWRDDRIRAKIELAFPFRRYLFDENPSFQWVHGGLNLSYQTPRFLKKRLAPRLEELLYFSHLDRPDLLIKSYYRLRNTTLADLVLFVAPLEVSLGVGADIIRDFKLELVPGADVAGLRLDQNRSVRVLGRLRARMEPSSEAMRRDQRHHTELRLDLSSSDAQKVLFEAELAAQLFFLFGRHRLVIRPHAVVLTGDVRFWDEMQLAGDWQRVFFDNRYWVHEAAQLALGYRLNVWSDWIDVGVFHDISIFGDRTRPEHPVAWANAFGPSLHLMLFDTFALDVYMGFGFAPVGFNQTLSFALQSTF